MKTFHKPISMIAAAAVVALAGSVMAENGAPAEMAKPLALRSLFILGCAVKIK
jgi:hypothetical protein